MQSNLVSARPAVVLALVALFVVGSWLVSAMPCQGESVPKKSKHVIGATATIKEVNTGLPFAARVDTGAATCSIHVEDFEIKDPAKADPHGLDVCQPTLDACKAERSLLVRKGTSVDTDCAQR